MTGLNMIKMKNEFVSYEMALALKELGFDEPCFTYYKNDQLSNILELVKNSEMKNVNNEVDNYISAPTFSQAFRFFRERHGLYGLYTMGDYENNFYWQIWRNDYITKTYITASNYVFEKYEEAELACLLKLIEIVKNK